MEVTDYSKAQGHWILAKMGKRVLRPGGKELTQKLIAGLDINNNDDIVEFAPGVGYTASLSIGHNPKSYVGVDADEDAIKLLKGKLKGDNIEFKLGQAASTDIESESKDKVYGEAMLTMHVDKRKSDIIREAHRILKKGGLYAIHELGLRDVNEEQKAEIQKDLALCIRVNARPLTEEEWTGLLEQEGFKVKKVYKNAMHLLENKRIVDDEGLFRALKITFNILTNTPARKRINEMKRVFKMHDKYMNSIVVIAEKI